jgi:hypothetical protein
MRHDCATVIAMTVCNATKHAEITAFVEHNLTPKILRETLDYDAVTGNLTYRALGPLKRRAGRIAGSIDQQGYRRIFIAGKLRAAHRLVWLHAYGDWPRGDIDHIDGDRHNNRLCNLRDVSRAVNIQNQWRAKATNRTGFLGCSLHEKSGKFRASIRINGRLKHLGIFESAESAHEAYRAAKREFHPGCTI